MPRILTHLYPSTKFSGSFDSIEKWLEQENVPFVLLLAFFRLFRSFFAFSSSSASFPFFWSLLGVVLCLDCFHPSIFSDSFGDSFSISSFPQVGESAKSARLKKTMLWECDHWTKVRLRRDKLETFQSPRVF